VHQDPPFAVERDDAGGDVLDHALDHLLFAQQPLARLGDPPRHLVDRLDERRELHFGGRQVERRRAGGDPPRPFDQLGKRPREVARQARRHGQQQSEEAGAHQHAVAAQVGEVALHLLLLRQERHRQEEPRLRRRHPRHAQRRVELEVGGLAGAVDARGELIAEESEARVDLPRDALGQQAGGEQLVAARGVDAAPPVEVDLVAGDPREPDQEVVVERGVEAEAGGEGQDVVAEHLLHRVEGGLAGVAAGGQEPALRGTHENHVEQQQRDKQQESGDDEQPLRIGADGAAEALAEGGARQRQEQRRGERGGGERQGAEGPGGDALERRQRPQRGHEHRRPTVGQRTRVGHGRPFGRAHRGPRGDAPA
jgi:hypothetical protein